MRRENYNTHELKYDLTLEDLKSLKENASAFAQFCQSEIPKIYAHYTTVYRVCLEEFVEEGKSTGKYAPDKARRIEMAAKHLKEFIELQHNINKLTEAHKKEWKLGNST